MAVSRTPALSDFPPRLLHSNDVPSEAEALEIRSILDRDYALLTDRDVDVQHVTRHLLQGRSILSIIRRLPFDILAEISYNFCEKSADVWLLGRVCKPWKTATLALPALWSIIDLGLPLPVVVTHLENSKSSPLTVNIRSSDHPALELLVQHSERWEIAHIGMRSRKAAAVLEPIHNRLPLLRRLEYRDGVMRARPLRVFEKAPRLLQASVGTVGTVILPWVQLKRLSLEDNVNVLQPGTNLVELTLAIVHHPHRDTPEPLVLPHLRKLLVRQEELLGSLTCPALDDLFLGNGRPMSRSKALIPFLVRSACPLRKFTSEFEGLVDVNVISILNLLPTLIELRLIRMMMWVLTKLISHLVIPPNDTTFRPVAPALRAIALSDITDPLTCETLIGMIASRRSSQCPILSLCVLNFNGKPRRLPACASSTTTILRTVHQVEVKWLTAEAANAKMRSWELDYPR
ncbi:hypothetical protein C8R47DRAFT_1314038 [Mycena vitilis]|nr:hypothetical protein C8R47DRAFT_1314038 [Mycena vitilis]